MYEEARTQDMDIAWTWNTTIFKITGYGHDKTPLIINVFAHMHIYLKFSINTSIMLVILKFIIQ